MRLSCESCRRNSSFALPPALPRRRVQRCRWSVRAVNHLHLSERAKSALLAGSSATLPSTAYHRSWSAQRIARAPLSAVHLINTAQERPRVRRGRLKKRTHILVSRRIANEIFDDMLRRRRTDSSPFTRSLDRWQRFLRFNGIFAIFIALSFRRSTHGICFVSIHR